MSDYWLIDPVEGEFDTNAIEHYLLSLDFSARDPNWPNTILLSIDEESLEDYVEQRRVRPDRFPPSSIRVSVNPGRLRLVCHTQLNAPARQFVTWFRERYSVRFLDEEFTDHTGDVDDGLDCLFGSSP